MFLFGLTASLRGRDAASNRMANSNGGCGFQQEGEFQQTQNEQFVLCFLPIYGSLTVLFKPFVGQAEVVVAKEPVVGRKG